jgi:type I restriction enzyme S subunit
MSSETEASTMKQEETTALLPKLRFPEFRGTEGWKEKPLKAAAEINPANGGLPESFVYIDLESVDAGELKAKDRISRVGAPSRAQRLVERGDIIYQVVRPYQRNNLLCEFDHDENYVASTGYAQLRANDNNRFLYQSIHTDFFVGRVIAKCTGSNYPAINSSDLAEIHLPIPPSLPEQQKIADFLSSLDELIAAQARKAEALKTHKKGLMQQLFPRQGESQPRLRFPEFQDAGEWECQTFADVAQISSGTTPLRSNLEFFAGGTIPWVKTTDLNNSFITETEEYITPKARARINPAWSILVAMYGGFKQIGRTGCLRVPAATNQALSVLVLNQNRALPVYVLAWLNAKVEDWKRIASSSRKDPNITGADVAKFPIALPSPAEQQRIASCLCSLDVLITAETQKLEALKTHKKGLMQQLFPSTEESRP